MECTANAYSDYCMPDLESSSRIFINDRVSAIIKISAACFSRIAPLAQLDRASGYEPEGREFESLRAHHLPFFFLVGYLTYCEPREVRFSSKIGLAPISTVDRLMGNVSPYTVRYCRYFRSTLYLTEPQVPWSQLSPVSHIASAL